MQLVIKTNITHLDMTRQLQQLLINYWITVLHYSEEQMNIIVLNGMVIQLDLLIQVELILKLVLQFLIHITE